MCVLRIRSAVSKWGGSTGIAVNREESDAEETAAKEQSRMLYVDHIDGQGCELFDRVCELDLEGIVAKRKHSEYRPIDRPAAVLDQD